MHNIDCIRDWDWEGGNIKWCGATCRYILSSWSLVLSWYIKQIRTNAKRCAPMCLWIALMLYLHFFSLSEFPEWAGLIILSPATGLLYCLSPGFHLLVFPCNRVQLTSFYALMLLYLFQNFQKTSFLSRTQSKPSNPSTFECVRCFFICDDIYSFLW